INPRGDKNRPDAEGADLKCAFAHCTPRPGSCRDARVILKRLDLLQAPPRHIEVPNLARHREPEVADVLAKTRHQELSRGLIGREFAADGPRRGSQYRPGAAPGASPHLSPATLAPARHCGSH